jgi:hypothetical protein
MGDDSMLKLQDVLILGAAFLSFLFSISLWFGFAGTADREAGIFVGIWVPSILATGLYIKLAANRRSHG